MADPLYLVPLMLALGCGWWLGRRERARRRQEALPERLHDAYFNGLTRLIDNDAEGAIEHFVEALKRDSGMIRLRLALGTLFRQRGEIQRATQLHQDILAAPDLGVDEAREVKTALAEDYLAAGLHDRAEHLLSELVKGRDDPFREVAGRLLLRLFEREREWRKALELAGRFRFAKAEDRVAVAHYCCELAEEEANADQGVAAVRLAEKALEWDPDCVRASLFLADWHMAQGQWRDAVRPLRRIESQAPGFVSEAIPRLVACYRQLDQPQALRAALEEGLDRAPSTTALLALADILAEERGDYQAASFMTDQLKRRPTVKGFNRLIDFHLQFAEGEARESLMVLRGLSGQLLQAKPRYRCRRCGFSGKQLHWQCPGCRAWGTLAPIQGLEGD